MPISKELIKVSKLPWFPNVMKELGYEPVRHGHWCVTQAYPHTIYCSECFQRFAQAHWAVWEDGSLPRDYCPNCGAKMDEPTQKSVGNALEALEATDEAIS